MKKLIVASAVGCALFGVMTMMVVLFVVAADSLPTSAETSAATADLPSIALSAYEHASAQIGTAFPGCAVPWWVLAGVGWVESHHAQDRQITADGEVAPPITGDVLDGTKPNEAAVTFNGAPDQAQGPMQILWSTWAWAAQRANGDGQSPDPQNYYDAALSAAVVLCHAVNGGDLSDQGRLADAATIYENSPGKAAQVVAKANFYSAITGVGTPQVDASGAFSLPVDKALLTVEALRQPHHNYPALDIPLPEATPVRAVEAGTVAVTFDPASCGLGVVLTDADGFHIGYCHLSGVVVVSGATVIPGQVIGASGGTVGEATAGDATGPHLHVQIQRPDGNFECPGPIFEAWYSGQPLSLADSPTQACVG